MKNFIQSGAKMCLLAALLLGGSASYGKGAIRVSFQPVNAQQNLQGVVFSDNGAKPVSPINEKMNTIKGKTQKMLRESGRGYGSPWNPEENYHNTNDDGVVMNFIDSDVWDSGISGGIWQTAYKTIKDSFSTFLWHAKNDEKQSLVFDTIFDDAAYAITNNKWWPENAAAFRKNKLFLNKADTAVTVLHAVNNNDFYMSKFVRTFGEILGSNNLMWDLANFVNKSYNWAADYVVDNPKTMQNYQNVATLILFMQSFNKCNSRKLSELVDYLKTAQDPRTLINGIISNSILADYYAGSQNWIVSGMAADLLYNLDQTPDNPDDLGKSC